ncbi:hypothetical protein Pla52n_46250 [Stieleria varia]|uniref:Uncharacterized protein n=1 Tax=Stieleria varia TaxID=2528005 RepID=A0A5C6APA5_9BACT|nr:hypothetical protein Pla52n_46250 [Stieleria varia]
MHDTNPYVAPRETDAADGADGEVIQLSRDRCPICDSRYKSNWLRNDRCLNCGHRLRMLIPQRFLRNVMAFGIGVGYTLFLIGAFLTVPDELEQNARSLMISIFFVVVTIWFAGFLLWLLLWRLVPCHRFFPFSGRDIREARAEYQASRR